MSTQDAKRKALVDAIIDGELDAKGVADEAQALGLQTSAILKRVARHLVERRVSRSLSAPQARKLFSEAFVLVTLASYAQVAQKVRDVADKSAKEIADAAEALGEDVVNVPAIRGADFKRRAMERAGALVPEGSDE